MKPLTLLLLLPGLLLWQGANADPLPAQDATPIVTVWFSPTCGCCKKWVSHLEENGFTVHSEARQDMAWLKHQLGIPENMASCHTARVGDYLIEGHVPASDIRRLLKEKPQATGLAAPGMPAGSPGMETDVATPPYQVLLFGGKHNRVFSVHH